MNLHRGDGWVWLRKGMGGKGKGTVAVMAWLALVLLALGGCASTGSPRAPSLRLPQTVRDLGAERFGDHVELHWTVPTLTTDRQTLERKRGGSGPLTAEICRLENTGGCVSVARVPVTAGQAVTRRDMLPAELMTGPARLVRYRVRVLNGQGRSADWSVDASAVAGLAPPRIAALAATTTDRGVQITWERKAARPGERVLLLEQMTAGDASSHQKTPMLAVEADPGGAIDPALQVGHRATYKVYRSESVTLEGRSFALNGDAASVTVERQPDTFAPAVPDGVLAAGVQMEGAAPEIDLSWNPNTEPDLAGYRVYRMEEGADPLKKLTPDVIQAISYRDASVIAGHTYLYRITAVDRSGNESGASPAVREALRP